MKFNAIALFLILLSSSVGLGSCQLSKQSDTPTENTTGAPESEGEINLPPKILGTFQPIAGTPYLKAAVNRNDDKRISLSSSYDKIYSTHNWVFLDAKTLATHRLFETNEFLIVETLKYGQPKKGEGNRNGAQNPEPASPITPAEDSNNNWITQWLVYEVIQADTNEDGMLNYKDDKVISVSNANGKEYTELLTGVSRHWGINEVEEGTLVLVYEKDGEKQVSQMDLSKKTVVATQPVVDLGPEVD